MSNTQQSAEARAQVALNKDIHGAPDRLRWVRVELDHHMERIRAERDEDGYLTFLEVPECEFCEEPMPVETEDVLFGDRVVGQEHTATVHRVTYGSESSEGRAWDNDTCEHCAESFAALAREDGIPESPVVGLSLETLDARLDAFADAVGARLTPALESELREIRGMVAALCNESEKGGVA